MEGYSMSVGGYLTTFVYHSWLYPHGIFISAVLPFPSLRYPSIRYPSIIFLSFTVIFLSLCCYYIVVFTVFLSLRCYLLLHLRLLGDFFFISSMTIGSYFFCSLASFNHVFLFVLFLFVLCLLYLCS